MGCLKLTYRQEPTIFLGASPEETDTLKWRVWVKGKSDFLGVDEVVQTQDRPTITYAGIAGNGDYSLFDVINFSLGAAGGVMNTTAAQLYKDRAALVAGRYSRQAVKGVEIIDKSLAGLSKTARNLGYAGLLLNGANLTNSYFNDGITASQAFDFAVGVGLTVLTVTNPALLIGFGIYGLLDAAGTFDSVKESLGGNTVILKH